MRKFFILLLSVIGVSCSSKIEVSGHRIDVVRDVAYYSAISVGSGIKVVMTSSDVNVISVKTFESVQKYVNCYVSDGTLYIEIERKIRFTDDINVVVSIASHAVKSLSLSGGSNASLTGDTFFDTKKVYLNLSGGASFGGAVFTDAFVVDISGGSRLNLSGKSLDMNLTASGGSNIESQPFNTDILSIDLSGGSSCDIVVNEKIKRASLSGGSKLYYRGTNILESVNVSGGSELINRN